MAAYGSRWYIVHCHACGYEHGFTAGALAVLVTKMQEGEVNTVKGNTVCLLVPLEDHTPRSTDPRFAVAERIY